MKILVTGAFSTGKSTLVTDLDQRFKTIGLGVRLVPDQARLCPFPLNSGQTEQASLWLGSSQIAAELSAESFRPDIILCDRGVPDLLAHELSNASASRPSFDLFLPFLKRWCLTYDFVFLSTVDDNIPPEADGLRTVDSTYRAELALHARSVLNAHKFHTLPLGHSERVAHILSVLSPDITKHLHPNSGPVWPPVAT